jgi:hypothetical protein
MIELTRLNYSTKLGVGRELVKRQGFTLIAPPARRKALDGTGLFAIVPNNRALSHHFAGGHGVDRLWPANQISTGGGHK